MTTASPAHTRKSSTSFAFVDCTPGGAHRQVGKNASVSVRAHAARASAKARLETIRRRADTRPARRGQRVFSICPAPASDREDQHVSEEGPDEERGLICRILQDLDASVACHAHKLFGGVLPMDQVDAAAVSHFLSRFKVTSRTERPWIELVTAEAGSLKSPLSLPARALQANASALCANDLQKPELHQHAIKQYLSVIVDLQALLQSPKWSESAVLYTCMIATLFECIQSNNTRGQYAHVKGVARLYHQRGPQSFAYGLEHKTFRYYRINMLMAALVDRKPSFLAENEWKTIPFSGDGPPKTILDLLVDILVELPGVLAEVEGLKSSATSGYSLIQQALKLAYWVRRLIMELEKWKQSELWAHSALSANLQLKHASLLTLCELATKLLPYDPRLGEAISCYCAAHIILGRIVWGLAQRSSIFAVALRSPYSLRELVQAIALVSERHISAKDTDMISLIVASFALKAASTTEEVDDQALFGKVQELLEQVQISFARKFNIHYSPSYKTA